MQEKYLNLHSKLSQMIWIILIATVVINVYLVQRSFDRFSVWDKVIIELEDNSNARRGDRLSGGDILNNLIPSQLTEQPQGNVYGLKISYLTLTILWPLLLLTLFMAARVQLQKRKQLLTVIDQTFKDEEKSLVTMDTYALTTSIRGVDIILFITVLVILPLLGFGLHLYFGKEVLVALSEAVKKADNPENVDGLVVQIRSLFTGQVIITALSMLIALAVNTYSLRMLLKKDK